eukprot:SAG22_NODE_1339_length_4692_cov_4.252341_6_plen_288_part_00
MITAFKREDRCLTPAAMYLQQQPFLAVFLCLSLRCFSAFPCGVSRPFLAQVRYLPSLSCLALPCHALPCLALSSQSRRACLAWPLAWLASDTLLHHFGDLLPGTIRKTSWLLQHDIARCVRLATGSGNVLGQQQRPLPSPRTTHLPLRMYARPVLAAWCFTHTCSALPFLAVPHRTRRATPQGRAGQDAGEATVMLLKAVITGFPCVSLPFLAVPLLSQPTVAISRWSGCCCRRPQTAPSTASGSAAAAPPSRSCRSLCCGGACERTASPGLASAAATPRGHSAPTS